MNARMPTEKAHGYQIAKMCEAFASAGASVLLIVPARKNDASGDVFSYYGVRDNFAVKCASAFDALAFFRGSRLGFYIQAISFLWALRRESLSRDTIVITRNPEIAWRYGSKRYQVFYDAHNFPTRGTWFFKWLLRGARGVIANSNGTADAFHNAGFKNILVASNAVDLMQFDNAKLKTREELGLPAGRIAIYVGHLYKWKGVGVVIEAARNSKRKDITFVFVGGIDSDLAHYRAETKDLANVIFLGRRPHEEVPALIKSADALLLPNIPVTKESSIYTSPIKMFEYMASGVPIVASDLPSIREVLNDKNAILVKSGDANALLNGIEVALDGRMKERAIRAREEVKKYTWKKRAWKILDFIVKTCKDHNL